MNIIMGNEKNFKELVSKEITLVDFFATWCGPCKMLGPVLEELASEQNEVQIVKIDVDQNPNLSRSYGIMSVPTMILFKNGNPVSTKNGYMPKEMIQEWIMENK